MPHPRPDRPPDPEGDKRRALKLAGDAARRADVAQATRDNAVVFAADSGASLREIAAATELDHMTVKRIIDRTRGATRFQARVHRTGTGWVASVSGVPEAIFTWERHDPPSDEWVRLELARVLDRPAESISLEITSDAG